MANTATITSTQVGSNNVSTQNQQLKENIVTITITNEVMGEGRIRLIGSSKGYPSKIKVNLYKVIVDDLITKKKTEYAVTRDAPVIHDKTPWEYKTIQRVKRYKPWYDPFDLFGPYYEKYEEKTNDKVFNVINTSFEPVDSSVLLNIKVKANYPDDNIGTPGFAIKNKDDGNKIKAVPVDNPYEPRKDRNYAEEVMIHIGGEYTNNTTGVTSTVGSFGCFGIFKPEQGNNGMKKFFEDVRYRGGKLVVDRCIKLRIYKRKNVKWNFKVDKNGNVI